MLLYNARATTYESTARRKNRRAGGGELGKIRETMGYGDKSPSILLGRSFQVLVSETSVYGGIPEKQNGQGTRPRGTRGKSSIGTHQPDDKMQFFARNKTLQDSGDATVILLD